jgi:plasmid maintenance system antidote protein VapI
MAISVPPAPLKAKLPGAFSSVDARKSVRGGQKRVRVHPLLDALIDILGAGSDAGLSRALGVHPSKISRIRSRHLPFSAAMLIRLHEESGMPIKLMEALLSEMGETGQPPAMDPGRQSAQVEIDVNKLFDTVRQLLDLRSDGALARLLKLKAANLAAMRKRKAPLSPNLLLQLQAESGRSIAELQALSTA